MGVRRLATLPSLRMVGISRSDPRLIQIAILSLFTLLGQLSLQFPIMPAQILVALLAACATELFFGLRKGVLLFPASALISALSLGLLLRPGFIETVGGHRTFILDPNNLWLHGLAGFLAIASKYWITLNGKHLFNPTNLAIVLLVVLMPGVATITPGQWGNAAALLFVVANCGYLIAYRVRRFHLITAFWLSYAACHAALLLLQGRPLYLWWDGVSSGAVLLFTFFMITDPRTSPKSVAGRVIYALLTSLFYLLLSLLSAPVPLLLALVLACCLVPLIDRRLGGSDQTWQLLIAQAARPEPGPRAAGWRLPAWPAGKGQPRRWALLKEGHRRLIGSGLIVVLLVGMVPLPPVRTALTVASFPPSPMMSRIAAPVRPAINPAQPAAGAAAASTVTVEITDNGFVSPVITITVGTSVAWLNTTGQVRSVVEGGGQPKLFLPLLWNGAAAAAASPASQSAAAPLQAVFASGDLSPTEVYSYQFDSAGVYRYGDPRFPGQRGEVRVFADRTTVQGRIQTSGGVAMPGVHVFLQSGPSISAITAADGSYQLPGVPIGRVDIAVDGRTTSLNDGKHYPFYNFFRDITPGERYVIERPTYLPAVMTAPVNVPPGATVNVSNPSLPGTVLRADGDTIEWPLGVPKQLSIDPVPVERAPSTLPSFMRPAMLITVQPAGMRFTEPAPVTFPNTDNLPPGTKTDLWSMNHATGMFESLGTMTVSADGRTIVSDPGVGLQGSSWHTTIPVIEGIDSNSTDDCNTRCQTNSATALRTGANLVDYSLVSYRSLDSERGLTFIYDSNTLGVRRAGPPVQQRVISVRVKLGSRVVRCGGICIRPGGTPPLVTATFSIAGRPVHSQTYVGVTGWGLLAASVDMVDASGKPLPTGVYPTNIHVAYTFGGTAVNADIPGEAIAYNESGSPFGAGWTLEGLQQLSFSPGAYAAVSESGHIPQIFRFRADSASFTSPPGDFSTITRNTDGSFVRVYPDGRQVFFDQAGRMTSDSDRHGNTTAYSYNQAGRLLRITDPVGFITTLAYAAGGRLQTVTDPAGRVTRFAHDAGGNLLSITAPDGTQTSYTYDANQRLLSQRHPKGNTTSYQYDGQGRVKMVTFADGTTRQFRPGETVSLAQDLPDRAPVPALLDSTDQIKDERGFVTSLATDRFGRVIQLRDATNRVWDYTRSDDGLLTSVRYPDGATFSYTYDARGQLLSLASSRLGAIRVTRDPRFGQLTSFTDTLGRTTTFELDDHGRPVKISDPAGSTYRLAFNQRGQLTAMTDPLGQITRYGYDSAGNRATITDPLGRTTSLAYDDAGNPSTLTDAAAQSWALSFDQMNRVTSLTDAAGGRISNTYDPNGYLTSWTDPNSHVTSFQYDAMNRLTAEIDALGKTTSYSYDQAGNLTSVVDPRGSTISATYDPIDRPLTITAPGTSSTLVYNQAGDLGSIEGNGLRTTLSYNGHLWRAPARVAWEATDDRPLDGSVRYDYRLSAGAPASAPALPAAAFGWTDADAGALPVAVARQPDQPAQQPVVEQPAELEPILAPANTAPQAPAPLATTACGTLSGATTWTAAASPYTLTCNVTIPAGSSLTVEPGVLVEANNFTQLRVEGTLTASGTAASPINWRLAGNEYWYGLVFKAGSGGSLNYVTISGATRAVEAGRYSSEAAINLGISNSQLNGQQIGLYLWGTALTSFSGNTLRSPGRPLYLYDGLAATTPLAGNSLPDGGRVHLGGGTLAGSTSFPAYAYLLEGNLTVPAGATLTVQPGVLMEANNFTQLRVEGTLTANGTAASPISWRLAGNEYWYGLVFKAGSRGSLNYANISGATRAVEAGRYSSEAAINLGISNSQLNGQQIGLYLWGTALSSFSGNTLRSPGRPLYLYDGLAATTPLAGNSLPDGGRVHLGGGTLAGNTTFPAYDYALEGNLTVPAGVTLTVQPGVLMEANNFTQLRVEGTLTANGTAASPINWRLAGNEYWYGLVFKAGSRGSLNYATISGATRAVEAGRYSSEATINLGISNSQLNGQQIGLYLWGTALTSFSGNTLRSPGRPLYLYDGLAATTPLAGNNLPDGGRVHLGGGTLAGSTTFPTYDYALEGNLTVPSGATLTVQPGVLVEANNFTQLRVEGTLTANGTAASPISWRLAGNEYWYGLDQSGGQLSLSYAVIEQTRTAIEHRAGSLALNHVVLRDNNIGIRHTSGSIALTDVGIEGNRNLGIENLAQSEISATNLWWGSAAGPRYRLNPPGNGDAVSDRVIYDNWLTEAISFQNLSGQLASVTVVTAGNPAQMTSYAYDLLDRPIALRASGPATFALTFSYDAVDQLTGIAPASGSPGVAVSYSYDAAGQLLTHVQRSPNGATTFANDSYTYDPRGYVLRATDGAGKTTSYSYDVLGQLASVTAPGGSVERYSYDPAGNRLSRVAGGTTTSYSYDAANQLLSSSDGWAYGYDPAGNLLTRSRSGQTDRFSWDGLGRLTRIDYADGSYSAYSYDTFGRRLSRRDRSGAVRYYVYDGPNLAQELDSAGKLVASYVYDGTIDHPYSMTRGGTTYFYLYDRLGSVIGLTDGAGRLVTRYSYDAWGNINTSGAAIEQPFGFAGREWDADSGLYYYRARFYDPKVGRFISRDPSGAISGINLYTYVENNPVNYVDPLGEARLGPNHIDLNYNPNNPGEFLGRLKDYTKQQLEHGGGDKGHRTKLRDALKQLKNIAPKNIYRAARRIARVAGPLAVAFVLLDGGNALAADLNNPCGNYSNSKQFIGSTAGSIVGGVIGGVLGGPLGAFVGASVGSYIGEAIAR